MSMKKLAMLTVFAGLAMMSDPMFRETKKPKKHRTPNERKKCFYKYCKNMRPNATDLYCCEECKKLAREMEGKR